MKNKIVTMPEIALIAGTRMAFGAGIGLLLAEHLSYEQRRAVGWTLCAVGLLTTIPLAAEVLMRHESNQDSRAVAQPNKSRLQEPAPGL